MDPTCACFTDSSAKCSAPRSNIACHGILEEHQKNMWHHVVMISCDIMWHHVTSFWNGLFRKNGGLPGPCDKWQVLLGLGWAWCTGCLTKQRTAARESRDITRPHHPHLTPRSDGTIWRHDLTARSDGTKSHLIHHCGCLVAIFVVSCDCRDSIKHIKPHGLRGRGEAVMLCHRKRQPGELSDVVSASQKVKRKRQPEMIWDGYCSSASANKDSSWHMCKSCIALHSSSFFTRSKMKDSWKTKLEAFAREDWSSWHMFFKHLQTSNTLPNEVDVQRNGGKMWKVMSEYASQVLVPLGSSWHTTSQEWPCDNC